MNDSDNHPYCKVCLICIYFECKYKRDEQGEEFYGSREFPGCFVCEIDDEICKYGALYCPKIAEKLKKQGEK